MSRINLEHNLAQRPRLLAPTFYSNRAVLSGPHIITVEGPTYQFLNANGSDRLVFLPEITEGGQFYMIANDGLSGDLEVVDALGVDVVALAPGDISVFVSSQAEWWVLDGTGGGTGTGQVFAIELLIDGGGSTITSGVKGDVEVPFDATIQMATLLADAPGSLTVDIWKDTYGVYPPTLGDSITGGFPPTLGGLIKSQNALAGWTTTTLAAGDTLRFNASGALGVTRATLSLKCVRV